MAVAWIFPGQGSQVVGMCKSLYAQVPVARDVFEQADAALNFRLTHLCFEGPDNVLTATENAQPALLTASVALLRAAEELLPEHHLWKRPQAVAGHSLGEYSALVAAEAFDLVTALRLVRRRGELMAQAREGTMAAVLGLAADRLDHICQQVAAETSQAVVIANYNAPDQLVVSGATPAVERVGTLAKEQGAKRVRPLHVSAAFHSPLMHDAVQGMQTALAQVHINDVQVSLISNVKGVPISAAEDVRTELAAQVMSPVRWIDSVRTMQAQGIDTFIEIGPGTVLTGLIKRIDPTVRLINLRDIDDLQRLLNEES